MTLAIFSMNAPSPKALGESQGSKGDTAPATGFSKLFSTLQSGQSPLQQAADPAGEDAQATGDEAALGQPTAPETAESDLADTLPADGTALPSVAGTGKDLPPALPVAGQPSSATADLKTASEPSTAAVPATNHAAAKKEPAGEPTQPKIPDLHVAAASTADRHPGPRSGTSVSTAGSTSPVPTAETIHGSRSGGHPAGSGAEAGEGRSQGGSQQNADARQGTLSVSLRVTPTAGETADPEAARPPRIALRSIADLGIAAAGAQDGPTSGTPLVQASGEQSGALSPASMFASKPSQGAEAQDIARIVDRLTAAREAVQPAAVAMAINHDEFGELSLRFDQLRTGQLSVQLSANTPEAQTALAAAASQQGAHASAGDSSSGAQAQQQQGQNAGRGAQAERDMQSGGGQSERGERHKQGGNRQQEDAPPRQQRPRDGVFA